MRQTIPAPGMPNSKMELWRAPDPTNMILNSQKIASMRMILRNYGIESITFLAILVYLYENRSRKPVMSDLSELNNMSRSGTTLPVDKLEKAGLVERFRDVEDRRQISVRLTEKGERLAQDVNEVMNN